MTAATAILTEAMGCHNAGEISRAETLYHAVLAQDPGNLAALVYLGAIALGRGDGAAAMSYADRALMHGRDHAPAWNIKGLAAARLGQAREALDCYERALRLDPGSFDAAANRAAALFSLRRFDEAVKACRLLLRARPDFAAAHCILGNALFESGRLEEAIPSFDAALIHAPRMAEAHNGRANVLRRIGRIEDAIAGYSAAIGCNASFAQAYNNRGVAWQFLRRYEEAVADYDAAIALSPDNADAHWNRALVLLLRGDYENGWPAYEWRWKSTALRHTARTFAAPQWRGEDITGKTILIHAEQGLGDTLQFCRYVPLVAARGARVVVQVHMALSNLLAKLEGAAQVITAQDAIPPIDVHCPLLSLPAVFHTTVDTIPAQVPYIKLDPMVPIIWSARLGPRRGRRRIGLVWAGRPDHHNDHNRSLPVEKIAPWLDLGFEVHCLQKEIKYADRNWAASRGVIFHDHELIDMTDTAGLIAGMDVVISVDTAPAHLAGACGRPTWVLLPYAPDFRWLTERDDSPWYPTARLFRQEAPGDWTAVISAVTDQLRALA
jgi:tetratricopeptide (TPR) repeat protein